MRYIDALKTGRQNTPDTELQKKEAELATAPKRLEYSILSVKRVPKKDFTRVHDGTFVYDIKEYLYGIFQGKTSTIVTLRGRPNLLLNIKVDWDKAEKYRCFRFKATPEEVKAYLETKDGQEDLVFNAYE